MKCTLIGMGCGPGQLTAEAYAAIREARLIFGARRLLHLLPETDAETIAEYRPREIAAEIQAHSVEHCCVLYSGDRIVGFSMGEFCRCDCFDVHFEKAYSDINGAYPMVCREFTRMLMARHPELLYMNREDDMGLEPLRRSKLSYKPEFMVRKYTARWIYG